MSKLYILDKPFNQKKKNFFSLIMKLSFHDHGKQMLKRLFYLFIFLNNPVGGSEKMS